MIAFFYLELDKMLHSVYSCDCDVGIKIRFLDIL